MGYGCYTSSSGRDQGYGVPAKCDHPGCDEDIDRGIAFACGDDPMETVGYSSAMSTSVTILIQRRSGEMITGMNLACANGALILTRNRSTLLLTPKSGSRTS